MDRRPVAIVFMLSLLPGVALAQNAGYPTPAEYAERALAAERARLFQSHEPLRITLRTDIEWLVDERIDSVEVEGTVTSWISTAPRRAVRFRLGRAASSDEIGATATSRRSA
jgi:hypothetical protein